MNVLDIRTVLFSQLVTDGLCTIVLAFLWLQNRNRYAGISYWVVDFIFQTTAILLIVLRGSIPDWLSIGLSSPFVIAGAFVGYLGLERFVGKRSSQIPNYVLVGVFLLIQFYFVFTLPDLEARNLALSLGLLVICFQCTWLLLRRAGNGLIQTTQAVAAVFALFCLVSLIRVFIIIANPVPNNDFFQSGLYDTLILMSFQILLILLTFGLVLMVNRRLLMQVRTQEEKFTKAFHSSPYGILITRLSDGLILDVNRGFVEMIGYLPSESIGKTTFDLRMWAKETDRQEVVAELSAKGELQGRQFLFRTKAGLERTVPFYAEILIVENENLILSSFSDITEQIQADEIRRESEGRYRSLFENMLNGFAYCQMIFEGERPQDFIYLDVNRAFESLTGLKDVVGRKASEVIPGIREADPQLIATYGRVALTGQPEAFETYVESMKMWFSISVYGLRKGFFVAVFDVITERKRVESELREDEARLHLALDAAKGGTWEWNLQTNENIWSEELWKVYGLEPHSCEPSYEAWLQTIHPDDRAGAAQAVQTAAREATELYAEWRVRERDGVERWLMSRGRPLLDANGQAVRFIGAVLDITERKQAELGLLSSEAKYRHTLDAMLEGCQIIGLDWRYLYLNEVADKHNRRPKEELLGQKYMDMWPGIESTQVFAIMRRCMDERTSQTMENEFRFPDGSRGWFELRLYPVPEGIVILSIDITEHKRAEEALSSSENRYRELVQNANSAILRWRRDGTIVFFNEYAQRFFGYSAEEAIGQPVSLLLPETESTGGDLTTLVQDIVDHPENFVNQVNENICRDGRRAWMAWTNKPTLDENGQVNEILAVGVDITERKRVEDAQKQSELLFRTLFELSPDAITLIDPHDPKVNSPIIDCNDAACRMNGYQREELIGHSIDILNADPYKEADRIAYLQKVRDAGSLKLEVYHRHKNGTNFPVEISTTIIKVGERELMIGLDRDITERKLAEQELRRTLEDLKRSNAELEQFAYVASHDLQEPLRMVSSYVQLLERRYKGKLDKDADEFIGFAVDGADRMQRLINDLLAFSRVGTRSQPFTKTSSEAALAQALDNLQVAIQENKARVTHDPLPDVFADGTQLVQLFQNLIANAIKFHSDKTPQIRVSVGGDEKEWIFSVRDNGIGIEPQYTERIFIIFQRLHGHNQYPGTGIGLALCKKIVQQHGGRIWVESQPDQGATFFFSLPKKEL